MRAPHRPQTTRPASKEALGRTNAIMGAIFPEMCLIPLPLLPGNVGRQGVSNKNVPFVLACPPAARAGLAGNAAAGICLATPIDRRCVDGMVQDAQQRGATGNAPSKIAAVGTLNSADAQSDLSRRKYRRMALTLFSSSNLSNTSRTSP